MNNWFRYVNPRVPLIRCSGMHMHMPNDFFEDIAASAITALVFTAFLDRMARQVDRKAAVPAVLRL